MSAATQPPLPPQPSVAPKTTEQEDITLAGQRRINLIWEWTQSIVALTVVISNMIVGILFAVRQTPMSEYPMVLSASLFLVVGFYFSRTNHAAIGGVGWKPMPPYEGR